MVAPIISSSPNMKALVRDISTCGVQYMRILSLELEDLEAVFADREGLE
jgi:hypothetical protein